MERGTLHVKQTLQYKNNNNNNNNNNNYNNNNNSNKIIIIIEREIPKQEIDQLWKEEQWKQLTFLSCAAFAVARAYLQRAGHRHIGTPHSLRPAENPVALAFRADWCCCL